MALTDEQGGVPKRMMFGLLIALAIVIGSGAGTTMDLPAGMTPIDRLAVAAHCALVPGLLMLAARSEGAVSIGFRIYAGSARP